jgi:predicted dehydrogenase
MALQWGLIGCGDISCKRVAPALRDLANCELVGVSRARTELAESFAREFGARKWFSDWRELVSNDEIHAVYIATPVNLHASQTVAAAEAGKHVLCEKPMALDTEECDRMIAACRTNNVLLGIAYYRHFYPAINRVKSILLAGEIGRPVLAQINAFEWFNPEPAHPRYWLIQNERSGGGPMFDFGCHRIEVLLNLLGSIAQVQSLTTRVLFRREVEDTAIALFRFTSGSCATLSVTHAAREGQDTLDIFCSDGSIHIDSLNEGNIRVSASAGDRQESLPPAPNFHQPLIDDFTSAVTNNRQPQVTGELGREVAQIEAAIYRNAQFDAIKDLSVKDDSGP